MKRILILTLFARMSVLDLASDHSFVGDIGPTRWTQESAVVGLRQVWGDFMLSVEGGPSRLFATTAGAQYNPNVALLVPGASLTFIGANVPGQQSRTLDGFNGSVEFSWRMP